MIRKKLGAKVILGFLILAAALILCISITIVTFYFDERLKEYKEQAFAYAKTAAQFVDGDRVLSYLETGEKDDYYQEVMDFLNAGQKNSDILYYYVFVPYADDLVYIWDAENYEGACPLGYHEDYLKGGREAVEAIFRQNPPENLMMSESEAYGSIASAYSPIFNSAGEPVAVAAVDLSVDDMALILARFLVLASASILVVIIASMLIFFVFVRKKIVAPIKKLNTAAKDLVGNLEAGNTFSVSIHTHDEIEELAKSFEYMNLEVRNYISQLTAVTAEKERIGAELSVATHIQSSMLPCIFPAFPDRPEFDIYATMTPAKEVGGDFYDFFMVDDRHIAIVMADVSGKGVPAALFMVIGKTLIKDHTQPELSLSEVFETVNNMLCESNEEGLFITAFEGVLDLVTGEFRFANAGHEPPFIRDDSGTYQIYKALPGFVLAGMEGMKYKEGSFILKPGSCLFQYTDGVTEATNADNELYGMERLEQVLNANRNTLPRDLLPAVKADIDRFVGDAPQFDDITMLCLEYRERMKETSQTV